MVERSVGSRWLGAEAIDDEASFVRLVEELQSPVFAFVGRMLRPAGLQAMTEDIAQETFLRAFRSRTRFDVERGTSVRTWVFTIAYRLSLNELRRTKGRPTSSIDVDRLVDRTGGASEPHAVLDVIEAMARLRPEHRAIVLLRHYHGLAEKEIAEVLDIGLGAVKSRLNRARASLARHLGGSRD